MVKNTQIKYSTNDEHTRVVSGRHFELGEDGMKAENSFEASFLYPPPSLRMSSNVQPRLTKKRCFFLPLSTLKTAPSFPPFPSLLPLSTYE